MQLQATAKLRTNLEVERKKKGVSSSLLTTTWTPNSLSLGSQRVGKKDGWEQLLVLCIHLTLPPFNSSVYPLEWWCMLLLLFYFQKPVLLVSVLESVGAGFAVHTSLPVPIARGNDLNKWRLMKHVLFRTKSKMLKSRTRRLIFGTALHNSTCKFVNQDLTSLITTWMFSDNYALICWKVIEKRKQGNQSCPQTQEYVFLIKLKAEKKKYFLVTLD